MVSLPCRRARKAKDATKIPKENVREPQTVLSPATQTTPTMDRVYTGDERQALESLFQQMDLPDIQTSLDMPSAQQSTRKKDILEGRHSRLELLSKRIRSRLSRDSGLRKSKSKPSVVRQSAATLVENQPLNSACPGFLPDILGSGPASEGGYDSDAQCIVTPRAKPSIAGSARMSAEDLIPESNQEPKDLKNEARTHTQEMGSPNGVKTDAKIDNLSKLQTVDLETRSKLSIQDSELPEHLNSRISGSPSTRQANKIQPLLPAASLQLSPRVGSSSNYGFPKPGISRTQESRASEPVKSSENMAWMLPQRCMSVTPISQPRVPSANRTIGSPDDVLSPLDNLSRILEVSNSYHKSLESIYGKTHRRDTSSMYASHPNSLPPSPNSSTRCTPFALTGELYSIAAHTSLNEVQPATTLNITNGIENNTMANQKGEPSIASSKTQGITESKFTEQLESQALTQDNKPDSLKGNYQRSSRGSRSTSDGWLSGGRRQGYGYDFVSEADEDTDIMWKRALKAHVEEQSRQRSGSSFNWKGKRRSAKSSRDCSAQSGAEPRSAIGAPSEEAPSSPDQGKILAPEIGLVKSKKEKNGEGNPVQPLHAWTKFPSHSRAERCASAGTADNIIVRDFSASQGHRTPCKDSLGSPQVDGPVEMETSRKSGKEWFRPWEKLSRPSSVDLRRYRAGLWAGVSRSGHLKYPELELIPDGPKSYVVMEELGNVEKANKLFLRRQRDQTKAKASSQANAADPKHTDGASVEPESRSGPASSPGSDFETGAGNGFVLSPLPYLAPEIRSDHDSTTFAEKPTREPLTENISAKMWSTLYEDCVNYPASDNGMDALSVSSISSTRAASPDKTQDQRLAAISTSIDLHNSTIEFKELQLADEVKTRDSLMKMVEAAWGTDVSERGKECITIKPKE